MSIVQLEVPEEVLISLKETPETISRDLSILAAAKISEPITTNNSPSSSLIVLI